MQARQINLQELLAYDPNATSSEAGSVEGGSSDEDSEPGSPIVPVRNVRGTPNPPVRNVRGTPNPPIRTARRVPISAPTSASTSALQASLQDADVEEAESAQVTSDLLRLRLCEDGLPLLNEGWLELPEQLQSPLPTCSVSMCFQVIPRGVIENEITGTEWVFIGEGEGIPEQLQRVAWATSQINRWSNFGDSITATRDTILIQGSGKKNPPVTGVMRRNVMTEGKESTCKDYSDGRHRPSFMQMSMNRVKADRSVNGFNNVYHLVTMEWGLIPVEYLDDKNVLQRKIIHALRIIPMYGFDLLHFLQHRVFSTINQRSREQVDVPRVAEIFNTAMQCEMSYLEPSQEVWESLPDPWACTDVESPASPTNILCPFNVLSRIRNLVGTYKAGTLRVDGFPVMDTDEKLVAAETCMFDLATSYLKGVKWWYNCFKKAKAALAGAREMDLVNLLHSNGIRLDRLRMGINMKVEYDMLHIPNHNMDTALRLVLPQSVIAVALTFFFRVTENREEAIMSQLMDKLELATPMNLRSNSTRSSQYGDYPCAAMHSRVRVSHNKTLSNMMETNAPLASRAESMRNFLKMQFIVYENGIRMGMLMSERAAQQAKILRKFNESLDACQRIAESCDYVAAQMEPQMQVLEQALLWDEWQMSEYLTAAAWLTFNKNGAYMNALNLSGARAVLTGDVLLWLGIDNKSWTFFGFISFFNGGASHMRAPTTDGRGTAVNTSKANSAGFSNVVIAGYDNLQGMVIFVVQGLTNEDVTYLKVVKYDRSTRSATESTNAVVFAGNQIVGCPSKEMFLRTVVLDEMLRNLDAAALDALITGNPRDNQLPGMINKFVPNPNTKAGGMILGRAMLIPGFPLGITAATTNQNPPTVDLAEKLMTFLCVVNSVQPGAHQIQPSDVLTRTGKRKDPYYNYSVMDTCRASGIPECPEMCKHICQLLTIVPMMARQTAGIQNKLGAVRYEICKLHRMYLEWFFQYFQKNYLNIMGSTLAMSYNRVCSVQTSRGVASCLMSTMLTHARRPDVTYDDACVNTVMDMQSSATTGSQVFRILYEVVRKNVDTNLLMINGIVKSILNTPILSFDFLRDILDPSRSINVSCDNWRSLQEYLINLCNCRRNRDNMSVDGPRANTTELMGSYVLVKDLATAKKYRAWELSLERYMSIMKGSTRLYINAINECTQKSFDLSKILNVDPESVTLKNMCKRMHVDYEDSWDCDIDTGDRVGSNFLFCVRENREDQAGKTANEFNTIGKCFVDVVMNLAVTSLIGQDYPHGDNRDWFAGSLCTYISNTNMPSQCLPSRLHLLETFVADGIIRPQVVRQDSWDQPDYFTRSVIDDKPWVYGRFAELDCDYWNYAIEDIMHMGPYLQMLENLQAGKPLDMQTVIEYVPDLSYRAPELTVGRFYPLFSNTLDDEGNAARSIGSICIAPAGLSFVSVQVLGVKYALPFESWFQFLQTMQCVVGPLVHRANAVIRLEAGLGLIQPIEHDYDDFSAYNGWTMNYSAQKMNESVLEKRAFMKPNGSYTVWTGMDDPEFGETEGEYSALDVHTRLVAMGTHVFVKIQHMPPALTQRLRHARAYTHIEGWLRCPLPSVKKGERKKMYVGFRVMESDRCDRFNDVEIVAVSPAACALELGPADSTVTYILPAPVA